MEGASPFDLGTGFQVPSLETPVPVLELNNTEKRMLIALAQEGQPLGKLLRYFHDYGAGLRQAVAGADMEDPAELKEAKKVQSALKGADWVLKIFESALTLDENENLRRSQDYE